MSPFFVFCISAVRPSISSRIHKGGHSAFLKKRYVPLFLCELGATVPGRVRTLAVQVAIAAGEVNDKITILEIKSERISDERKLEHVRRELAGLMEARERSIFDGGELKSLVAKLKSINESLWRIEDDIRSFGHQGDYGDRFIELARSVYENNDRRAAVKRRINERLGSKIVEEKSYGATGSRDEPVQG
jgi:Family of unknown function (DUF6165)